MEEPSMLVQRPSSSYSQETSHILVGTFRELYSLNGINEDTVENLATSKTGDQDYHNRYVEKLQAIHRTWNEKTSNARLLANHLKEAQSRAKILEQEEQDKYESYSELGLPPVSSKLCMFLDKDLLKLNHLIIPAHYTNKEERPFAVRTESEYTPQYVSTTFSSRLHFETMPQEDNYLPEPEPMVPSFSNSSNTKSKIFQRKSQAQGTARDKNLWRKCINPKQREIEKKDISNLQSKADFLKNPRFIDQPKAFLNKASTNTTDESLSEYVEFFKPHPFPIVFRDYQVDEVYEIKLELRNVTASSRQVRITQPATPYFSVSHGEFPTENGLVAPGMFCQYTVRFAPDSLADYDDVLEVKTQSKEPLLIPLQARREPPALSLADIMNCGFSLVGNTKFVKYSVCNSGGAGKFSFKLKDCVSHDFAIDWNKIDLEVKNVLRTKVFSLDPSCFLLGPNECIDINVTFTPTAVNAFLTKLCLYCDNCVNKEYILEGTGEVANVKLSFVDNGIRVPLLGETYDESAQNIIQFDDCYPHVSGMKELQISNTTSVPLQFNWQLSTPSMSQSENIHLCKESVFNIQPKSGSLRENSTVKFFVEFCPMTVGNFYDVASLVLNNIPVETSEDSYTLEDITSLKFSIKGSSQNYLVSVSPAAIILSGKHFCDKFYKRSVTLHNESNAKAGFSWKSIATDTCTIDVVPNNGTIEANSKMECLVSFQRKKSGTMKCLLEYEVPFSSGVQGVYIEGTFVGPEVNFVEKLLNFELIRYGTSGTKSITLHNNSPTKAVWKVKQNCMTHGDGSSFDFYPVEGIIQPNQTQSIAVHFNPNELGTFRSFLECQIADSKACYLPVHAEVQRPNVVLSKSELLIEEAFVDVTQTSQVTITNTTLLPSEFQWNKVSSLTEDQSDQVSITCEPESGVLKPHEHLNIQISLTFHTLGVVEFFLPCTVKEMLPPVVLAVKAVVKGLNVDFSLPNIQDLENKESDIRNNDIMEFGDNVLIGTPVCALLMMENRSAIQTTFSVCAKQFPAARVPTPPKGDMKKSKSFGSRPLLSKTANIADYNSKTEEQAKKDYAKSILRGARGVAFVCSPDSGELQAFEKKVISVTAYSDMWGEYNDVLICKVGDLEEKLIPVHIDVIGSPLSFQISKEQPPLVRFGAHVSGGQPINRSLRINNTSHVDIRLDWETFVIDPEDNQLIDFNVYIGDAFPLYDENGDEVCEMTTADQLIRVSLAEHYGKRTDAPFKVDTPQVVIPAQSNNLIDVSFQPLPHIRKEVNYLGYALGYMSLNKLDRSKPGLYSRLDGLDMLPFALNLNGGVKPAKLYLEACDAEGFTFELSASELLHGETNIASSTLSCVRRFVLVNNSGVTVSFSCNVSPPFKLVSIDGGKIKTGNKTITLKSEKNVEIKVAFIINRELITSHHKSGESNIKGEISIEFKNNTYQNYDLIGIVNYPIFTISRDQVDFGVCFVSETRERAFTITNPSKAALYWKIEKDEKTPETSKSVFTLSQTNGELAEDNSTEIKIYFSPRHNVEYGCTLNVSSISGARYLHEEPIKITLLGAGSYDEGYRGIMNM